MGPVKPWWGNYQTYAEYEEAYDWYIEQCNAKKQKKADAKIALAVEAVLTDVVTRVVQENS